MSHKVIIYSEEWDGAGALVVLSFGLTKNFFSLSFKFNTHTHNDETTTEMYTPVTLLIELTMLLRLFGGSALFVQAQKCSAFSFLLILQLIACLPKSYPSHQNTHHIESCAQEI